MGGESATLTWAMNRLMKCSPQSLAENEVIDDVVEVLRVLDRCRSAWESQPSSATLDNIMKLRGVLLQAIAGVGSSDALAQELRAVLTSALLQANDVLRDITSVPFCYADMPLKQRTALLADGRKLTHRLSAVARNMLLLHPRDAQCNQVLGSASSDGFTLDAQEPQLHRLLAMLEAAAKAVQVQHDASRLSSQPSKALFLTAGSSKELEEFFGGEDSTAPLKPASSNTVASHEKAVLSPPVSEAPINSVCFPNFSPSPSVCMHALVLKEIK